MSDGFTSDVGLLYRLPNPLLAPKRSASHTRAIPYPAPYHLTFQPPERPQHPQSGASRTIVSDPFESTSPNLKPFVRRLCEITREGGGIHGHQQTSREIHVRHRARIRAHPFHRSQQLPPRPPRLISRPPTTANSCSSTPENHPPKKALPSAIDKPCAASRIAEQCKPRSVTKKLHLSDKIKTNVGASQTDLMHRNECLSVGSSDSINLGRPLSAVGFQYFNPSSQSPLMVNDAFDR